MNFKKKCSVFLLAILMALTFNITPSLTKSQGNISKIQIGAITAYADVNPWDSPKRTTPGAIIITPQDVNPWD